MLDCPPVLAQLEGERREKEGMGAGKEEGKQKREAGKERERRKEHCKNVMLNSSFVGEEKARRVIGNVYTRHKSTTTVLKHNRSLARSLLPSPTVLFTYSHVNQACCIRIEYENMAYMTHVT